MICENCGSEHNGSYGSGRFCSSKCARCFSTKANRAEINEKVSKALRGENYIPQEDFCLYCGGALKKSSKRFCSIDCHTNYENLIYVNKWKLGIISGVSGKSNTSTQIKNYFKLKHGNKCQKCGWHELNKYTGKVPLELHHNDGNYMNNDEDNLSLLCPNCHSLTSTYKAANRNNNKRTHR